MIYLVLLSIFLITIANGVVTTGETCGGIQGIQCLEGECVDIPDDDCDPLKGGTDCLGVCDPYDGRFCGGIAAFQCATNYMCTDDTTDDCDPLNGGADCGGICRQICGTIQGLTCPTNYECNDDPSDDCDPSKGGSDCRGMCEPIITDYNGEFCAGKAGIQCPTNYVCLDDTTDDCDPLNGGTDCGGICRHNCGGFLGFLCPGDEFTYTCIDIPNDGCDPKNGGADCGGFCDPVTTPVLTCPLDQPTPGDKCGFDGTCEYGSETCCGETYASFACDCDPLIGTAGCYYTDACLGAEMNGCGTTKTPDICTLPAAVGECDGIVPRWFYNSETEACEQFEWGGCGGNKNNFETEEACINECNPIMCATDVQECCAGYSVSRDPTINCEFPTCESCVCGGIAGAQCPDGYVCIEDTTDDCDPENGGVDCYGICTEIPDISCDADVQECCDGTSLSRDPLNDCKFPECASCFCGGIAGIQCNDGYECIDDTTDDCDPKTTGADCGGICTEIEATTKAPEDICDLEIEVGTGDAAIPRYYYNSEIGECEEFFYAGQNGNENNFETIQECERSCEDPCDLAALIGEGGSDMNRYFYNKNNGLCQAFKYGGAKGNANNFVTEENCQEECAYSECKYADKLFRFENIEKICKFCFKNYWDRPVCKKLSAAVGDTIIDFVSNGFIVNDRRNDAQCFLDYCKNQKGSTLESDCEVFNVRFNEKIDLSSEDACTCDLIYCDMTVTLGGNVGRLGVFIGFVLGLVTMSWM